MIDFQRIAKTWACQEPPPEPSWDLWGYIRSSSDPQVNSPEVQAEKLAKAAVKIVPALAARLVEWMTSNVFVDLGKSGTKIRYRDRPEFKRLMECIQPGDRLIVWRADRIDRDDSAQIEALNWLGKHEVWLYIEEMGLQPLDLSRVVNRVAPKFMAVASQFVEAQRIQASIAAKELLADNGTYIHGKPIPGFKLVWQGGKRAYRHDEAERVLVREIRARAYWGTSQGKRAVCGTQAVFNDFTARGEVTAAGKPWSKQRVCRVARWWLGCIERGLEPWVDCDPYSLEKRGAAAEEF